MSPTVAAINHLLAQQPWAQGQLVAHRGKTVCINGGIAQWFLSVTGDGFLERAAPDAVTAVTVCFKLSDVPLMLANVERAVSYVKIGGDADFASALAQLGQSLRWDAETDLSKVCGDIAAARIVAGARSLLRTAQTVQGQLAEQVAEYFLEEQAMLIRPYVMTEFSSAVVKLRDDLERLCKRMEKLERR